VEHRLQPESDIGRGRQPDPAFCRNLRPVDFDAAIERSEQRVSSTTTDNAGLMSRQPRVGQNDLVAAVSTYMSQIAGHVELPPFVRAASDNKSSGGVHL
jgi:hypothetical protein